MGGVSAEDRLQAQFGALEPMLWVGYTSVDQLFWVLQLAGWVGWGPLLPVSFLTPSLLAKMGIPYPSVWF
jgi:hypothetical protein